MIETGKISAADVGKRLLVERNIFVKDLSSKIPDKNYLRFAVRASADNDKLLDALKKNLSLKETISHGKNTGTD